MTGLAERIAAIRQADLEGRRADRPVTRPERDRVVAVRVAEGDRKAAREIPVSVDERACDHRGGVGHNQRGPEYRDRRVTCRVAVTREGDRRADQPLSRAELE